MQVDGRNDRSEWFCDEVRGALPALLGVARRLAGNEADAEDLVAEAVARAWKHLDALERPEAFQPWLTRILTNTYISQTRKPAARAIHEPYAEDPAEPGESFSIFERLHQPFLLWWANPEQEFFRKLLRQDIERAVDALPDEYRVVVVLCDVQGFSYGEIAETLELPLGTVKSRLSRGRSLLQRALWEQARDAGLRGAAAPQTAER